MEKVRLFQMKLATKKADGKNSKEGADSDAANEDTNIVNGAGPDFNRVSWQEQAIREYYDN